MMRTIEKVFPLKPTLEGAGVHLKRGFGFFEVPQFDPFLLFDDFSNDDPRAYVEGFPWHPHRGIETVTYMLRGEVEHRDSLGNAGKIGAGDIQWMSAGSGIVHEEMPVVSEGGIQGFQLWVNLPRAKKMTMPQYQDIKAAQVPIVEQDGVVVKVIAGAYGDTKGPVSDIAGSPTYLDVSLQKEAVFSFTTNTDDTLFIYVIESSVVFKNQSEQWVSAGEIGLTSNGDELKLAAGKDGARLLVVAGTPLGEPISWRGPIVMNTDEEIKQAFTELQQGTFIKS